MSRASIHRPTMPRRGYDRNAPKRAGASVRSRKMSFNPDPVVPAIRDHGHVATVANSRIEQALYDAEAAVLQKLRPALPNIDGSPSRSSNGALRSWDNQGTTPTKLSKLMASGRDSNGTAKPLHPEEKGPGRKISRAAIEQFLETRRSSNQIRPAPSSRVKSKRFPNPPKPRPDPSDSQDVMELRHKPVDAASSRSNFIRARAHRARNAATTIQAGWRGYVARREITYQAHMATKIQAAYRGHVTRTELKNDAKKRRRRPKLGYYADIVKAVVIIQSAYRGHLARRFIRAESVEHADLAATIIQEAVRTWLSRRHWLRDRTTIIEAPDVISSSALAAAAYFHGTRVETVDVKEDHTVHITCATNLSAQRTEMTLKAMIEEKIAQASQPRRRSSFFGMIKTGLKVSSKPKGKRSSSRSHLHRQQRQLSIQEEPVQTPAHITSSWSEQNVPRTGGALNATDITDLFQDVQSEASSSPLDVFADGAANAASSSNVSKSNSLKATDIFDLLATVKQEAEDAKASRTSTPARRTSTPVNKPNLTMDEKEDVSSKIESVPDKPESAKTIKSQASKDKPGPIPKPVGSTISSESFQTHDVKRAFNFSIRFFEIGSQSNFEKVVSKFQESRKINNNKNSGLIETVLFQSMAESKQLVAFSAADIDNTGLQSEREFYDSFAESLQSSIEEYEVLSTVPPSPIDLRLLPRYKYFDGTESVAKVIHFNCIPDPDGLVEESMAAALIQFRDAYVQRPQVLQCVPLHYISEEDSKYSLLIVYEDADGDKDHESVRAELCKSLKQFTYSIESAEFHWPSPLKVDQDDKLVHVDRSVTAAAAVAAATAAAAIPVGVSAALQESDNLMQESKPPKMNSDASSIVDAVSFKLEIQSMLDDNIETIALPKVEREATFAVNSERSQIRPTEELGADEDNQSANQNPITEEPVPKQELEVLHSHTEISSYQEDPRADSTQNTRDLEIQTDSERKLADDGLDIAKAESETITNAVLPPAVLPDEIDCSTIIGDDVEINDDEDKVSKVKTYDSPIAVDVAESQQLEVHLDEGESATIIDADASIVEDKSPTSSEVQYNNVVKSEENSEESFLGDEESAGIADGQDSIKDVDKDDIDESSLATDVIEQPEVVEPNEKNVESLIEDEHNNEENILELDKSAPTLDEDCQGAMQSIDKVEPSMITDAMEQPGNDVKSEENTAESVFGDEDADQDASEKSAEVADGQENIEGVDNDESSLATDAIEESDDVVKPEENNTGSVLEDEEEDEDEHTNEASAELADGQENKEVVDNDESSLATDALEESDDVVKPEENNAESVLEDEEEDEHEHEDEHDHSNEASPEVADGGQENIEGVDKDDIDESSFATDAIEQPEVVESNENTAASLVEDKNKTEENIPKLNEVVPHESQKDEEVSDSNKPEDQIMEDKNVMEAPCVTQEHDGSIPSVTSNDLDEQKQGDVVEVVQSDVEVEVEQGESSSYLDWDPAGNSKREPSGAIKVPHVAESGAGDVADPDEPNPTRDKRKPLDSEKEDVLKRPKLDIHNTDIWISENLTPSFLADVRELKHKHHELPDDFAIEFMTDIEGNMQYLELLVQKSNILSWDENHDLVLRDKAYFVHGGDIVDKGPGDIRCMRLMLKLKIKYPNRVFLIIGNRDANKVRFISELQEEYWGSNKVEYLEKHTTYDDFLEAHRLETSESSALQWMLCETMGCRQTFENRRQEISELLNIAKDQVSDDDVLRNFKDLINPKGSHPLYLQHLLVGQMMVHIGDCLFTHGAIHKNGIGFVPGAAVCSELSTWVRSLNEWMDSQIQEFSAAPFYDDSGSRAYEDMVEYTAPWFRGSKFDNLSMVYSDGFVGSDGYAPRYPDQEVIEFLQSAGISRVIVGHRPQGDTPTVIRDNSGVLIIVADTSFSDPKADRSYNHSNFRGNVYSSVVLTSKDLVVHGETCGNGAHGYKIPTDMDTNSSDKEAMVGRELADKSWVKSVLASGELYTASWTGWTCKSAPCEMQDIIDGNPDLVKREASPKSSEGIATLDDSILGLNPDPEAEKEFLEAEALAFEEAQSE